MQKTEDEEGVKNIAWDFEWMVILFFQLEKHSKFNFGEIKD